MKKLLFIIFNIMLFIGGLYLGDYIYYIQNGHSIAQGGK